MIFWLGPLDKIHLKLRRNSNFHTVQVFESVTHNTERGHCMKTEAIIRDFDAKADERGLDFF